MPRVDFARIQGRRSFTPLPEGTYPCRLVDVDESTTRSGDPMWKLTWRVLDGEYRGRRIFDTISFSERALKRTQHVLFVLGLDVGGKVDLVPEMILGRDCLVAVAIEDFVDATGGTRSHNKVPFTGYRALPSTADDEEAPGTGEPSSF